MKRTLKLLGLGAGLLAAFAVTAEPAAAQSTLDIVKKRGHLRCQIGTPAVCRTNVPPTSRWKLSGDASEVGFVHLCLNETIAGIEITDDASCVLPEAVRDVPVIADATSTLMSRPLDVTK